MATPIPRDDGETVLVDGDANEYPIRSESEKVVAEDVDKLLGRTDYVEH